MIDMWRIAAVYRYFEAPVPQILSNAPLESWEGGGGDIYIGNLKLLD
jgi:hypothetical protein